MNVHFIWDNKQFMYILESIKKQITKNVLNYDVLVSEHKHCLEYHNKNK